jgi:ankyrin repeat protein
MFKYQIPSPTSPTGKNWTDKVRKVIPDNKEIFGVIKREDPEELNKYLQDSDGSVINTPNLQGISPLMMAAGSSLKTMVEIFLENNVDVNYKRDEEKLTVFTIIIDSYTLSQEDVLFDIAREICGTKRVSEEILREAKEYSQIKQGAGIVNYKPFIAIFDKALALLQPPSHATKLQYFSSIGSIDL